MPPVSNIRIPMIRTTVPRPRAIPVNASAVPGSSYANSISTDSSVGRVDPNAYDPIADLGNRLKTETAAMKAAHSVDVNGLIKAIKASQSSWKPPVQGLIGPISITGRGGVPAKAPTGSVKLTGGVDQWIAAAYKILGIPLTPSALANERYLIQHESSGNPRAVNNWDSNARAGNPSKGLEQTTGTTFRAYMLPGHGDIFNPIDNILASLRYRKSRYKTYDIGRYSGGY